MLTCLSDITSTRRTENRVMTKNSTKERLEEAQELLQRWYDLSMIQFKANPNCQITRCNMVFYHLISLNAVTNFPEIERLARREGFEGSYWELSLRHKRCIFGREEAIFHCGQVFRHLRSMLSESRPSWWSAALYRATLTLWADGISTLDPNFQRGSSGTGNNNLVKIDQLTPEDPAVNAYRCGGEGLAVLTGLDGLYISLDKPAEVLHYAIRNINAGFSSRIGDGIKRKLIALGNNWSLDTMGASAGYATA